MEIQHVTLESDTPGQAFTLRVIRFRGTGGGPSVYLQAALHAHEIPGMVALDRLIARLDGAERAGRLVSDVTVVPHANPVGLAQALNGETLGRFDFNSRTNFNRSFPPGAPESRAGRAADDRLKATLLAMAIEAEVVLDLHCDDEGPVYIYVAERQLEEGRRLARCIAAEFILFDSVDAGVSFDTEVLVRWKAQNRPDDRRFASTIEYRGMLDVAPALAEADAAGLYRFLVAIGAVHDSLPEVSPVEPVAGHVDDAELIPSPVPGAILYDVSVGDRVAEGQRLAAILPEPGAEPHALRAPFDGVVMTRRNLRFIRRGDHVLKVLRRPEPGPGA